MARRPIVSRSLALISASWLTTLGTASALTYHIGYIFEENNNPGKRAQIEGVMNEAVAAYNSTTNFNVDINVSWHPGIPTAQSDYNGTLGFGGSISTQVAIHEIAHYLGSGTTGQWDGQFGGGNVWNGAALKRYVKLFDGPGAEIYKSGVHYYPYGFNYGNEDSPNARYRIGRILRAMRMDMGGQDADGDGMPDEWERYKSGSTALKAGGDADGDGISDFDEWWTDSPPMWVCPVKDGHVYQIRSRLSQMLMEAADATTGANIRQNPNNGSDLQKWIATYVGGGYWKFTNLASGKCPDVFNFSVDAGANVVAWDDTGNANQQWRLFPGASGAGYWKIGNRNSTNMVIDVNGGPNATGANTNIGQYFDDLNAFNEEWMFDDVTPGVLTDGLVANYKLDGNPRDFSGRNFHGTASGGISWTAGRIDGLAATFNGSNGSIRVPAMVERNFTLACWVKTTATAGTAQWYNGMGIIDAEVPGVAKDFGLALVGNKAAFGVGQNDFTITSSVAINDGNWHHLTATLNTDTGAMKLYVDGTQRAGGTGPIGARISPATFTLGSIGGVTGFLNGSIDEARIYNKILSQDEINRLVQTGSSLVASYSFDGNDRDATHFDNHGDSRNVTYIAGKTGGQAVQLSGSDSFVKLPASVTSDFSVAFWVKTAAVGGAGQWYAGKSIVDADVPGIANDWGISVVGNHAAFGVGNTGAGTTIESTTDVNDGTWHHVVATRINASGAMKLYVDGSLQATGVGSTALRDAPGGIRVGSTLFGGAFLDGAVDDLKIFNYAVAAAQVASLANTIPAPWSAADVGLPASDGYSGYNVGNEVFSVTGGGAGDQLQLVSTPVTGDQILVTRLDSFPASPTGIFPATSTAGITLRDSKVPDSPMVEIIYDRFLQSLRFRHRNVAGGAITQTGDNVPVTGPVWLRFVRVGNSFSATYSTTNGTPGDGDWLSIGSQVTPLSATALAGLRVSSGTSDLVATASFSSLSVIPPTPGQAWRQQHFADIANLGDAEDSADPDNDGTINQLERAFGQDPLLADSASAQPQLGQDASWLSLTYQRSLDATDLNFQVLWSNDLVHWSDTGVIDAPLSATSTTETRIGKVPVDDLDPDHAFLKLEVR